MSSFFADNLRTTTKAIGSYDDDKDIYNLTLNNLSSYWQKRLSLDADYQLDPDCEDAPDSLVPNTTVSFKEGVDGWTSRKDFIQESGITLNNNYYTFKNGRVWLHGVNTLHNNFYGVQYDSSFNVVFNEMPQVVKGFSTLNYTGTASRILEYEGLNEKWYSIAEVNANQIIPTGSQIKKHGWYTSFVRTDLEAGKIKEFQKKEGKYFNYIKGTLIGCEPDGGGIGPCLNIVIHNAFTPNGDSFNQYFNIENIEDIACYPTNNVQIYNRWGVKVYSVDGYGQDSKFFRGISEGRVTVNQVSELPVGTYWYILKYKNASGEWKQRVGYLYLNK